MNWFLLSLVGLLLFSCSTSPTIPTSGVAWRGAVVAGVTPEIAVVETLEPAWQHTPRDWEPTGWTITMHVDRFECPGWGLARGCTDTRNGRHRIDLVFDSGAAAWELCNARRWDRIGTLRDLGCGQ